MGAFADLAQSLRTRANAAFDALPVEAAEELRQLVSVPVEYVGARRTDIQNPTRPHGIHSFNALRRGEEISGRIIRSRPNEAPRKEFGTLQASFRTSSAAYGGSGIESSVFTDYKVSAILEVGGAHVARRPHWGPVHQAWEAKAARRVGQLMFG